MSTKKCRAAVVTVGGPGFGPRILSGSDVTEDMNAVFGEVSGTTAGERTRRLLRDTFVTNVYAQIVLT